MKHPIQNKKKEKKTVTKMQTMKIYNTLAEGENQKVTIYGKKKESSNRL